MEVLNKPVRGVKVTKIGDGKWKYEETEVAARTFLERNYYMPFTRSKSKTRIIRSNKIPVISPGNVKEYGIMKNKFILLIASFCAFAFSAAKGTAMQTTVSAKYICPRPFPPEV